jgi:hypothetical protein
VWPTQLAWSAQLFGVLASRVALDLLAGRAVRRRIVVDVHPSTRPGRQRWRIRLARLGELARMSGTAATYRRCALPGAPDHPGRIRQSEYIGAISITSTLGEMSEPTAILGLPRRTEAIGHVLRGRSASGFAGGAPDGPPTAFTTVYAPSRPRREPARARGTPWSWLTPAIVARNNRTRPYGEG